MRPSSRRPDQIRPIEFTRHFTDYAEGSVLCSFGNTKVLCNASISEGVPHFLRDAGQGWVTAEYSMLPRATHQRTKRESKLGQPSGRTTEIQRLIGRSLRAAVDMKQFPHHTITIDCDVLQADGGTRTAAISGAYVALVDALSVMQSRNLLNNDPITQAIAAVSVGIHQGLAILDLEYSEDCTAETDMNIVMTDNHHFVEIQGTAERQAFNADQLQAMLALAETGCKAIFAEQAAALSNRESQ